MLDDVGPQDLVVQAVLGQVVLIEEVTERAVPHVVQERCHTHQRLDVRSAGHSRTDILEARVEVLNHPASQVHHPHDMLETSMLRSRKNPPSRL